MPDSRGRLRLHDQRHRTHAVSTSMTTPTRPCPTRPPSPACCPVPTRDRRRGRKLEADRPRLHAPAAPATPTHAPRPSTSSAGADVTCTFTNTEAAVRSPSTRTPPRQPASTSASRPAAPDSHRSASMTTPTRRCPTPTTFTGLLPGPYSVTEGAVANWKLTGLDCTTGGSGDTATRSATINLVAGRQRHLHVHQHQTLGSITINKDASPDSPVDFGFTTTGTGLTPFSLDDDADPTLPQHDHLHRAAARRATRVTESAVANWALTGLDCSTGGSGDTDTRTATINLVARRQRHLHLHQHRAERGSVDHDPQGRRCPTRAWTSRSPPPAPASSPFSLDDDTDPHAAEHDHVHRPAARHLLA